MIYWIKKYFSDPDAHWSALYEVFIVALFSISPFVVSYFVLSAKRTDGSFSSLDDIVGRGQVYLLGYGIFGTIFWLAFLKGDRPRHGARAFLGAVATLSMIPIVGFLGVDATFSTILNTQIVAFGFWFYSGLLIIYYLLLFYMNITPPGPNEIIGREADSMRDRYEELRKNG